MEVICTSSALDFDRMADTRSYHRLTIDMSAVKYVTLYNLMCLACALLRSKVSGREIRLIPPNDPSVCAFVSRLGFDRFFKELTGDEMYLGITSHDSRDHVIVELRTFDHVSDITELGSIVLERHGRHVPHQMQAPLESALWELADNVVNFSKSQGIIGAVVQRPNRRDSKIHFAIGDAGIGLRQSFLEGSAPHRPVSDHAAISLALTYLVSSTSNPQRGHGLWTTVNEAIGFNGVARVRSGASLRTLDRSNASFNELELKGHSKSVPNMEGTLVSISLPAQ